MELLDFEKDIYEKYFTCGTDADKREVTLVSELGMPVEVITCFDRKDTEDIARKLSLFHPSYIAYFNRASLGMTKGEERTAEVIYRTGSGKKAVAAALLAYIEEIRRTRRVAKPGFLELMDVERVLSEYCGIKMGLWHYMSRELMPRVCEYKYLDSGEGLEGDIGHFLEKASEDIRTLFGNAVFLEIRTVPSEESERKFREILEKITGTEAGSERKE